MIKKLLSQSYIIFISILTILISMMLLTGCDGGASINTTKTQEKNQDVKLAQETARTELQGGLNNKQEKVLRQIKQGELTGCDAFFAVIDADPDYARNFALDIPSG